MRDFGTDPIPKHRYLSREFAGLEWERMWTRVWLLACFERDLAQTGDYATFEVGPESVLLVRQSSGDVAAHYNVCSHRGNRLVLPGRGHARRFVCSYHAWQFGIDGKLERPLDPETFPQGCPNELLDLRPVRCERWGGFVWVNLDPDAEPLLEYLGVLPAHLDPYHFEEMAIAGDYTLEVACNWKTSVDAFNEAYHISGTHPDTLPVNDDVNVPIDCYDRHSRMRLKLAVASPRLKETGVNALIRAAFLGRAGIDGATFAGGPDEVRPAIAKAMREVQGPALGADFSELHDEQLVDDFHYTVFPNLTFNIFGQWAWLFRHRPHPDDPQRTLFDFFHLVRAPSQSIPRPAHATHVWREGLDLDALGGGGELLCQDMRNLPRIQAGMRSAGFAGLHLGSQELRIRHFHRTLDGYLEDA